MEFGKWNTAFKRCRNWVKADVFQKLFDAVSMQPDMEYAMLEATIVRVHRHEQGVKGDFEPGHKLQLRRVDDQDIDADRYSWMIGSIRVTARTAA